MVFLIKMELFDRNKLNFFPLASRKSKSSIEQIAVNPDDYACFSSENSKLIDKIAETILAARNNNKQVIIAYGAHLIKNGLGLVLRNMIEKHFITHLATNGAGSIHDWEFAFHGSSEEDVEENIKEGQFGLWEETGKYINLALILGAEKRKGYGESICEMINKEELIIPITDNEKLKRNRIIPGKIIINHPYKKYSVQDATFSHSIPFTVHPGFGYDIIYTHPLSDGASIGKCAEIDFLKFAGSVNKLEGGVYLSIGSAIMSPMIFEKSLSMARNLAKQENRKIGDFMIVVNDIQEGNSDWNTGIEPDKSNPAYYLRFCKTFSRMHAREMHYIKQNNRDFLLSLYHSLKKLK
jgi:hypothetical protein